MLVPATLDHGLGQSMGMRALFMSWRQVQEPEGMGRGGYCSTSWDLSTAGGSSGNGGEKGVRGGCRVMLALRAPCKHQPALPFMAWSLPPVPSFTQL